MISSVSGVMAELPDEEWDTVGGLILGLAGRVPKEGESFEVGPYSMTMNGFRSHDDDLYEGDAGWTADRSSEEWTYSTDYVCPDTNSAEYVDGLFTEAVIRAQAAAMKAAPPSCRQPIIRIRSVSSCSASSTER